MYKMNLKYRELELAIESPTPIVSNIDAYYEFMRNAIHAVDKEGSRPDFNAENLAKVPPIDYNISQTHSHSQTDNQIIRDRLPNRSNSVDLSKLDIQMTSGTAHSKFRCPTCAQSAVLIANGQPIVRDVVNDDSCFSVDFDLKGSKKLTYEEACQHTLEEVRFVVGEGMESTCPMCDSTHPTEEFVKAYYHPLDYFESENLCPLCGESLWLVNEEGKTFLACEEPCIFKKEVQAD